MKKIYTPLFLIIAINCSAQWSNTTNQFYDSLHMPVCTEVGDQWYSMSIASYPDGGTIIFWEDKRDGFYSNTKIYAQKYDKNGTRLWAENGIPISSSANNQHFTFSSNQDYRNRKVAASDNAGGFFITYSDDSVATYAWQRMCVQHIKSDGSAGFAGVGFIAAQTAPGYSFNFTAPQLIGDDNGGFYIAYIKKEINDYIYIYGYKDEGGTMKSYGGGLMNENAVSKTVPIPCLGAKRWYREYPGTTVIDYNIFSDLNGGCSVVIDMNGNTADQYRMLCYNKVFKVKKDSRVTVPTLFPTGNPTSFMVDYKKDEAAVLYTMKNNLLNRSCTNPDLGFIVWVDDNLLSNGYQLLDQGALDYFFPKGVTISTPGNINVEFISYGKRVNNGGTLTDISVVGLALAGEKYDSIPYQIATFTDPTVGYNYDPPAGLNKLNGFRDTILSSSTGYFDFALAAGANQIYATALMSAAGSTGRNVKLQHLSVEQQSPGVFGITYTTNNKKGEVIGKEISTGFGSSDLFYDNNPEISVSNNGNALFYINEYGRYSRVSPIGNGAELTWGAMGKPIGTPIIYGNYYYPTIPFVSLDPTDGTGVISWQDTRIVPANTRTNIFMRHLDNLNVVDYTPPKHKIKPLVIGGSVSNPAFLSGSSKKYSTIEVYNNATGTTSPVVEILDDYNLGSIAASVYENVGAIRKNNNKAYLDRNYTIKPENNPAGLANISLRLFFTTEEFDALKSADPSITNPGSLVVIKQDNPTNNLPSAYIPVGGELEIVPTSWNAVDGGYYLEISVTGFSNFFIQKTSAALPLTWLNVQAQWIDDKTAKISWLVADQQNLKEYIVQQSTDGNTFTNACTVKATALTGYSCSVPVTTNGKIYFRILQTDVDGKYTYSKVVFLQSRLITKLSVYPNPATDKLYITGLNNYTAITITDVNGKVMGSQTVVGSTNSINISQLARGIYFIRFVSGTESTMMKFMKE